MLCLPHHSLITNHARRGGNHHSRLPAVARVTPARPGGSHMSRVTLSVVRAHRRSAGQNRSLPAAGEYAPIRALCIAPT